MKREDLKKYLLTFAFVLIFFILVFTTKALAFDFFSAEEIDIPEEVFEVNMMSRYYDFSAKELSIEELENKINKCEEIKASAHQLAEYARGLGWPEDCNAIKNAKAEHHNAFITENFYKAIYEEKIGELEQAKWAEKQKEYPEATQIWEYMKNEGWNDYVCAGILGNMMTEVGGNTLDLNPSSGTSYYGICQWNKNHKKVQGASLEKQCEYLKNTIKSELDTYGFIYKKNFNFNSFLNLEDAKQVALAFAKCYERCGSGSYSARQENAITAYNYFVD